MIKKDFLPPIVAAVLLLGTAGCAYEQPFSLPPLTPAAPAASVQLYPYQGYGGYYGAYGNGYRRGFYDGYYGNADPRYAGFGPYPYGYVSPRYPQYVVVQCPDANRDGRCDRKPPKHPGRGDDAGGDPQITPPPSLDDGIHDDGPRRRHANGSAPQARPVTVAPVPSSTRPPAARPPQATAGSSTQPAPARVRQRSADADERPARRPPPSPRSSSDESRSAPP